MVGVICDSARLSEGGRGVRFTVRWRGEPASAFAIRYRGRVYAYLNRCAHRQVELDWDPDAFFTTDGASLICATHGARYAPDTGRCLDGPCGRSGLMALPVSEQDGQIRLGPGDELHLSAEPHPHAGNFP